MSFDFEAKLTVAPRGREEVLESLREVLPLDAHTHAWILINELEEGSWRSGADEGYDRGYDDGCNR